MLFFMEIRSLTYDCIQIIFIAFLFTELFHRIDNENKTLMIMITIIIMIITIMVIIIIIIIIIMLIINNNN